MAKSLLILVLVGVMVTPATAGLEVGLGWSRVPEGAEAAGYVVNGVFLQTNTDWLGSHLLIPA